MLSSFILAQAASPLPGLINKAGCFGCGYTDPRCINICSLTRSVDNCTEWANRIFKADTPRFEFDFHSKACRAVPKPKRLLISGISGGSQSCGSITDCFNCSATAGYCTWDPNAGRCVNYGVLMNTTDLDLKWPTLFSSCSDTLGLCNTNTILAGKPLSNQSYGAISGQSYYFGIGPANGGTLIPQYYYCNWTFTVDPNYLYDMTINNYDRNQSDLLTMNISSS